MSPFEALLQSLGTSAAPPDTGDQNDRAIARATPPLTYSAAPLQAKIGNYLATDPFAAAADATPALPNMGRISGAIVPTGPDTMRPRRITSTAGVRG